MFQDGILRQARLLVTCESDEWLHVRVGLGIVVVIGLDLEY